MGVFAFQIAGSEGLRLLHAEGKDSERESAPKMKKNISYDGWLHCSLPLFSGSYQNQPWVKELRKKIHDRRVLSMDYV